MTSPSPSPAVSRVKERVIAPPRSAVPAPGASLFGRGFFRRLRDSGVRASGAPSLTLRCVRDEWVTTGSGENRRTDLEPHAIYRDTQEIPLPGSPGEPLDYIDFSFSVPGDQPGTDLARKEAVYWQVLVNVPLAGPNVETVFLAPVYRKP